MLIIRHDWPVPSYPPPGAKPLVTPAGRRGMSQRAETRDDGTEVPAARARPSVQPPAEAKAGPYRLGTGKASGGFRRDGEPTAVGQSATCHGLGLHPNLYPSRQGEVSWPFRLAPARRVVIVVAPAAQLFADQAVAGRIRLLASSATLRTAGAESAISWMSLRRMATSNWSMAVTARVKAPGPPTTQSR